MKTPWMDPINKIKFFTAFKTKAATVTLRDGRIFTCDYEHTPGQVLVKPEKELVPMGYFDLKKCSDPIWLELTGADQPDTYNTRPLNG